MSVAPKPRLTRRILLFVGIGLAVLVLYLYYYIGTVNVVDVIKHTNLFWYTSAFVAFLASVLFYTLAWRSLLRNLDIKTKIREVLLFAWAGMFFDSVVPDPGWSGDLSKAYMLSKSSGQEPGRIVASVVSQKIIVTAVTVGSLIFGLALLALNYTPSSNVLLFVTVVLFLTVFSLFMILYLSANEKATGKILGWIVRAGCFVLRDRWNPQDFRERAEQLLKRFHEGIRTLSANPKALARPISLSLLAWGFDISITFLTFASLGYPAPVDKVLIVYALTGSLQAVGVSFLGFTEIIVSGSYALLGIPAAISVSATLLTRVVTLWFKLVVSYFVFQWAGIGLLLGKGQGTKTPLPNLS
ncbi:MAG: flippase-like domain-containing protein [Candidatus Bathyarchaeia archaeon]